MENQDMFIEGYKRVVSEMIYTERDESVLKLLFKIETINFHNPYFLLETYDDVLKINRKTKFIKVNKLSNFLIRGIDSELEVIKRLN